MIRLIRGEERYIKYNVHNSKKECFKIKSAEYALFKDDEIVEYGECEIIENENKNEYIVSMKIAPKEYGRSYMLEITLKIADEIIKNRELVEVV